MSRQSKCAKTHNERSVAGKPPGSSVRVVSYDVHVLHFATFASARLSVQVSIRQKVGKTASIQKQPSVGIMPWVHHALRET